MPKTKKSESCFHDWVHTLPFQQQALLTTAMRGPDGMPKHCAGKVIVRYLRGVVLKPAGDWHGHNDNDFMWGDYEPSITDDDISERGFEYWANEFWADHDHYPHHFIMHLFHCAEVVAYKHPIGLIGQYWLTFYLDGCLSFHLNHETKIEMDGRLNDFGMGFLEK